MIELPFLSGKRIAVMGLARSGIATARALAAAGAEVVSWDDGAESRARAQAAGIGVRDLADADWTRFEMLVLSPGIAHAHPKPHPVAAAARAGGCPIVSDIELLWRARRAARFIAITGTNGKSTTTTLIGHVLSKAGLAVAIGGNLGTPALELAPLGAGGVYVIEISSYQLEITPSAVFDIAVLLNITPDHLDRHGTMAGYVGAKRLIFRGQGENATAIVGIDDAHCRRARADLAARGSQRVIPISAFDGAAGGVFANGQWLIDDLDRLARPAADLSRARALPGAHNSQNAAAAYAVARALEIDRGTAAQALLDFPGLVHRQESVAVMGGVRYVNDSKATNAAATARALEAYENIYWIAGGVPKEGGIEPLAALFGRVARAFLIGQAADGFARTLDGRVPFGRYASLEAALEAAHKAAQAAARKPAVVLLSPACASFDQFKDFEARGDAFRAAVNRLASAPQAEARA